MSNIHTPSEMNNIHGSVRTLPWADDAAVRGAFVERAETNAA